MHVVCVPPCSAQHGKDLTQGAGHSLCCVNLHGFGEDGGVLPDSAGHRVGSGGKGG